MTFLDALRKAGCFDKQITENDDRFDKAKAAAEEFADKIHGGQLIDLRDPSEFNRKHILGARNIPYQQLKMSTAALRKDKPVLIYENDRGQLVTPAALHLKKQGFNEIYILSYGLNGWNGKVKAGR